MCGIGLVVNHCSNGEINVLEKLLLGNRGPNVSKSIEVKDDCGYDLEFLGCVLHIQGDEVTPQPIVQLGRIFCWNGEVFGGVDSIINGIGDTQQVFHTLLEISIKSSPQEFDEYLITFLSQIWGPFAFIYFSPVTHCIYFGRDAFGRRSLMMCNDKISKKLIGIASVSSKHLESDSYEWKEAGIDGIYKIDLKNNSNNLIHWPPARLRLQRKVSDLIEIKDNAKQCSDVSQIFLNILKNALKRRLTAFSSMNLTSNPSIGVLFSGGIDSVLLAAVLHLTLSELSPSKNHCCIELINVSFIEQKQNECYSPDRLASISALNELLQLYPTRQWKLIFVDVLLEERVAWEEHIKQLIYPSDTHMDLNIGSAFWFASRGIGYLYDHHNAKDVDLYGVSNNEGRPLLRIGAKGVAKSLGRTNESMKWDEENISIKLISSEVEDDILNNKGKNLCQSNGCRKYSKVGCPWKYCKKCCFAHRDQLLMSSNTSSNMGNALYPDMVAYQIDTCLIHKGYKSHQSKDNNSMKTSNHHNNIETSCTSSNVASPHQESISSDTSIRYSCQSKVLIIGIGADEQMAGYGRHRTTYLKYGSVALENELNVDLSRLWQRNLGRDDRCVSDHGREAWFPFLDEELVYYLQSLPISQICDLSMEPGAGDKKILRDAAKLIGLNQCTRLVKRAIQFGTNVAKQTNVMYHGSNRKGKGTLKI